MNISLREYWSLLAKYLKTLRKKVALLAALVFGGILIQLVNPQIMRSFIDTATTSQGGATNTLLVLAVIFFVASIVQQVVNVGAVYVGQDVGWTSTNLLRRDLAQHCLGLDTAFHNERTPGEFIERVDGDVTALSLFFSTFVLDLVGNGILLLGVLALFFREDWRIGVTMGIFMLVMFLILLRIRNIGVPYWKATREASAEFYGFLEERLAGTEDLRAAGAVPYTLHRFHELVRDLWRKELKASVMTSIMINSSWFLVVVGNATAFIISATLFQAGEITIGTVYLIFHYSNILSRPIDKIAGQLAELQKASAGITRIKEMWAVEPTLQDGEQQLPDGSLSVSFDTVSFAYATDDVVIDNLSFKLEAGKILGLLGRTGSGKTTMTRLLLRLYDPQQGHIALNEVDLTKLQSSNLYQRVGMVTQNVQLFHASIRDNLTFFDPTIPDDRILTTLNDLGLGDWFDRLSDGLDTELESGGSGLSAGEAQLLAFARVFLKDPGLVILDEASSRLDPATEALIERAIDKLLHNRTAIIIAHRLPSVQRADEILILEAGQIREHGDRLALAADPNSRFSTLLKTGLEEVLV
ncbi:MAG: ABC transporter ATP-binding protein [Chloroflexota bacterium]